MTAAIGYQGPLSGPFAWLGEGLVRAIELALPKDGSLRLTVADAGGGEERAAAAARRLAADPEVAAVIGPTFSREAEASAGLLDAEGLAFVLPVATKPELSEHGWSGFFRIVSNDLVRAPLTVSLLLDELGARRPAIVSEQTESGRRLAGLVAGAFADRGESVVTSLEFERGGEGLETLAGSLVTAGADAVFFAGEYRDAAIIRRGLYDAGASAVAFVSDDGVRTPAFIETAGREAAEGALVAVPSAPVASAGRLSADYAASYGGEPVVFAPEAYQATSLLAEKIRQVGADRAAVSEALRSFDGTVAGRRIGFTSTGENRHPALFTYRVVDGAWVPWHEVTNERRQRDQTTRGPE
jgi:branched-chain amino acid transport system substrate-binding protein